MLTTLPAWVTGGAGATSATQQVQHGSDGTSPPSPPPRACGCRVLESDQTAYKPYKALERPGRFDFFFLLIYPPTSVQRPARAPPLRVARPNPEKLFLVWGAKNRLTTAQPTLSLALGSGCCPQTTPTSTTSHLQSQTSAEEQGPLGVYAPKAVGYRWFEDLSWVVK